MTMQTESALTGVVAAAAIAATLFIAAPASAQTTRSVELNYNAAELETPEGVQNVLNRIKASASKVCRSSNERMTASAVAHYQACRTDAIEKAVEDINARNDGAAIKLNTNRG